MVLLLMAGLGLFPGAVESCGLIDATYGIYSSEGLEVDRGVTINSQSIDVDDYSAGTGLGLEGNTVDTAFSVPLLDPASFPANGSSTKIDEDDSPINGDSERFFDELKINRNKTFSFTGEGPFHIDTLKVEDGASLTLSAGTYYVNKFAVGENAVVHSSPQVRLHIGDEFKIKENVELNSAGNPEDLLMFLHEDAKFESKKNSNIVSTIVGVDNDKVKLDRGVSFTGAIVTDGKVELKKNVELTLSPSQQVSIGDESTCEPPPVDAAVDHFVIAHDNNGIHCLAETITITAVKGDGSSVVDFVEQITLDTQSGFGTFSGNARLIDATPNDGLAVYSFVLADEGEATVSLNYEEGPSSIDIDAYQTSDASVRDDDNEAALVFAPSGFTVTGSRLTNPAPTFIDIPVLDQIAGNYFEMHLTAFGQTPTDPVCGVIEDYTGAQNIAFWMDYADPNTGTIVATVDGPAVASTEGAAATRLVAFSNGQAVVIAKYKDVGEIQVELKDGEIRGATLPFTVSPADFAITAVADSADIANPVASLMDGTAFIAAGDVFRVTVEVRDSEGSRTPNYGNESMPAGIDLIASNLVAPLGGRNGSANDGAIANSTNFAAVSPPGTFRNTAASWDEVGIIQLQARVAGDDYLGAGNVVGTSSGNVGRFSPAGFELASSAVAGYCGDSTYMGQSALGVSYQVEAIGLGGNLLRNYDAGLLGASLVATIETVAENSDTGIDLTSRLTLADNSWVSGQMILNTSIGHFSRAANPDGPYSDLQLGMRLTDPVDGLNLAGRDMNPDTTGDCGGAGNCDAKRVGASTEIVYGRLEVLNAFGSEIEAMDVKLRAASFQGAGIYRLNPNDSCSTYSNSAASLGNYQHSMPAVTVLAPATATSFMSGESAAGSGLLLSSPGATNTGSVDVTYDAPAWLEFDWNGTGSEDPVGTAIFGQFRGHDKVIYWREVY